APRDVDARPIMPRAQLARERHLLGDRLAVDILVSVVVRPEPEQAILPDLHDPFRAGIEPDHERSRQLFHMSGYFDPGHDRDVAGLHPAVRQIDRGWRLRRARYADKHDIGFLQILEMLAVVMQHRVVERIDALEIVGVERVLRTDAMRGLGAEIGLQELQDRPQDRQAGQAQLPAVIFEPLQKFLLEQFIENDPRRLLDLCQYTIKLLLGPHQRINVLHRRDLGVLRGRGPRDGGQRLTGCVRYEVEVEIAASTLRHDDDRINCELLGRRPRTRRKCKSAIDPLAQTVHIVALGTAFTALEWYAG